MAGNLPATNRKLVVTKISQNFREATQVQDAPMPQPGPGEILVKNRFILLSADTLLFAQSCTLSYISSPVVLPNFWFCMPTLTLYM